MNRRWLVGACIALLFGVGPAHAKQWVIPSGAHNMGAHGTHWRAPRAVGAERSMWRTDVRIFNPGDETAVVTIVHHEKGVANKARPSITLTVGPKGLLALDEIYDSEFNLESANGALMIEGDGDVASYVSVIDNLSNDPTNESGIHRTMEGGGGGGGGGGGSGCVEIPFVTDGTVVNYSASGTSGGMNYSGTITGTYTSATSTQSRTVFVTEISGFGTVTRSEAIEYGIIPNPEGYREVSQIIVSQTSTIAGQEDEEYMDTYEPGYDDGPFTKVCAGARWVRPPVTEIHEYHGGSSIGQTDQGKGEVVAIDEMVTTPAGTYTTVHTIVETTSGDNEGARTYSWLDIETGVAVRTETYDAAEVLTLGLDLTSIE